MEQQKLSSAQKVTELLSVIQILYQNNEISAAKKNKLAGEILQAKRSNNFSVMEKELKQLRFASSFKSFIDDALQKIIY